MSRVLLCTLVSFAFVGALVLLGGVSASQPAGAAPKLGCPGAGGKTVARTSRVRVFTRGTDTQAGNPNYYGCLYRTGTAFRLNPPQFDSVVDDVRLGGRFVATSQELCDGCSEKVIIHDLTTGKRRYFGPRGFGDVTALLVKSTGSAAFIFRLSSPSITAPLDRVYVVRGATARVVADGPGFVSRLSLSQDGRSVDYVKAGEQRSAPIP